MVIAVAFYFSGIGFRQANQAALVSPAEQSARSIFHANWQALNAQNKIPVTGVSFSMDQRVIEAYSARLNGLASQQMGMSQRALDAYGARYETMARYYQYLSSK